MKYLSLSILMLFLLNCGKDLISIPDLAGKDASPCTVVRHDNISTVSCPDGAEVDIPDGATGQAGSSGPQGAPGTNGTNGNNGQNGVDATPITMVQFCHGIPSYPSTFIEFGFCLQGSLYATYSANGGFTTYLPPGSYSSNAIGSSCNFTVVSGCQISN